MDGTLDRRRDNTAAHPKERARRAEQDENNNALVPKAKRFTTYKTGGARKEGNECGLE